MYIGWSYANALTPLTTFLNLLGLLCLWRSIP